MEAAFFFKMLVSTYHTTRRQIPEDRNVDTYECREREGGIVLHLLHIRQVPASCLDLGTTWSGSFFFFFFFFFGLVIVT
jgi:hypothetical protein